MKEAFWLIGHKWIEVADHETSMRDDPSMARMMGMSDILYDD